jgi:hypothetical protein
MASTYIIKLSDLDMVSKVHLPTLIEEVKKRRADLGEASSCTQDAFEGDLFYAPMQVFRDAIDAIQDLQTETVRRIDMGAEGITRIVRHHRHLEDWISNELRRFERDLPELVTDY